MSQLSSPRGREGEQRRGQFSSGFGELNLSANGLCHEASVGGRQEMRKERGRATARGRSRAKENKQEDASLACETTAGTWAGGGEVPPCNTLPSFLDLKKAS